MRINFEKLIKDSGEDITVSDLAREMASEGVFKNAKSAYDMIHFHIAGKAKGCDWELLKYLCARFNKKGAEIIQWDN